MRINIIIKMVAGLFALITNPSLALAAAVQHTGASAVCGEGALLPCGDTPPLLPPECKDHVLLKGDPWKARTIIVGEKHDICSKANLACVGALSKKRRIPKNSLTMLFEGFESSTQLHCPDYEVEAYTDDCRGWNLPSHKLARQEKMACDAAVLLKERLDPVFKEIKGCAVDQQKARVSKIINDFIEEIEQEVREYKPLLKIVKEKYPGTTFLVENNFIYFDAKLVVAKEILLKIKNSSALPRIVFEDMLYQYYKAFGMITEDKKKFIGEPNQSLLASIEKASKRRKNIVAIVGDDHVNFWAKRKSMTAENKKIVQELYARLDKFADTNPYAVLSCKL